MPFPLSERFKKVFAHHKKQQHSTQTDVQLKKQKINNLGLAMVKTSNADTVLYAKEDEHSVNIPNEGQVHRKSDSSTVNLVEVDPKDSLSSELLVPHMNIETSARLENKKSLPSLNLEKHDLKSISISKLNEAKEKKQRRLTNETKTVDTGGRKGAPLHSLSASIERADNLKDNMGFHNSYLNVSQIKINGNDKKIGNDFEDKCNLSKQKGPKELKKGSSVKSAKLNSLASLNKIKTSKSSGNSSESGFSPPAAPNSIDLSHSGTLDYGSAVGLPKSKLREIIPNFDKSESISNDIQSGREKPNNERVTTAVEENEKSSAIVSVSGAALLESIMAPNSTQVDFIKAPDNSLELQSAANYEDCLSKDAVVNDFGCLDENANVDLEVRTVANSLAEINACQKFGSLSEIKKDDASSTNFLDAVVISSSDAPVVSNVINELVPDKIVADQKELIALVIKEIIEINAAHHGNPNLDHAVFTEEDILVDHDAKTFESQATSHIGSSIEVHMDSEPYKDFLGSAIDMKGTVDMGRETSGALLKE
eukprot:NODE_131_length_18300_cov_0.442668.p3 type:complete len:538 gc:universal NODE_131_length_18300_cov_0.442668:7734-9347(+)